MARLIVTLIGVALVVIVGFQIEGGRTALRACEFRNEQADDVNQGLRERGFVQDVRIADLEAQLAKRP